MTNVMQMYAPISWKPKNNEQHKFVVGKNPDKCEFLYFQDTDLERR